VTVVVLLVDDDDSFRSALAENLRDDGHEVLEYALPADVPSLDSLEAVRVLITDYEMPGSTGLAFADRFHAVHPQVPVLLVTAFPTPQVVAQSAARTFVHLLRKPLDYDDLRKVLPAPPPVQ
jgi:DNA-binding NtrC family response regulator